MLHFPFHPQKAVQAAAYFLKLHSEAMDALELMKLLYRADRLALDQFGWPITGDRYICLEHGPVLSRIYDYLQGTPSLGLELWSTYIHQCANSNTVKLLTDPGTSELCEAEEKLMTDIYSKRENFNPFEWKETTNQFPEWENPHRSNQKFLPLDPAAILTHLGKSDLEIESIRENAEHKIYLEKIFNGQTQS